MTSSTLMAPSTVSIVATHDIHCADAAVVNNLPTPYHLGVFDQQVFPFVPIDIVFVYPAVVGTAVDLLPVDALRQAVSQLLVYYPHLTGRFQLNNSSSTYEISNFGQAIPLLDATCEETLEGIASRSICAESRILTANLPAGGMALVPAFDPTFVGICRDPILAIQRTRFACGGVALGIRIHHMVCDAGGAFQLIRNLTMIYRKLRKDRSHSGAGALLDELPVTTPYLSTSLSSSERERVRAVEQSLWYLVEEHPDQFEHVQANAPKDMPESGAALELPRVIGRTLHFSSQQLCELKVRAIDPNGPGWVSAFEAVSAYLCQTIYKARVQLLNTQGLSLDEAAAQLCQGFWASIDTRPEHYLDLGPRYFPNASFIVIRRLNHTLLYDRAHGEVATEIHGAIRAVDCQKIRDESTWFAAQTDKSKVRVDYTFGSGNFTVSQWSKHDMYAGVAFDDDLEGNPIRPALVAPPFTSISLVDGLGMFLSAPEEESHHTQSASRSSHGYGFRPPPKPIDINLTLEDKLWLIIDESREFDRYLC